MRVFALVGVLALLTALPASAITNLLCVANDGVIDYRKHCVERQGFDTRVTPSPATRRFAWISRGMHTVRLGILPAGANAADLEGSPALISGNKVFVGPDGADGTVVITETEHKFGTWSLTLDAWWFREGRLNIGVPHGTYDVTLTAGGQRLGFVRGMALRPLSEPQPSKPRASKGIVLRGRAIGPSGAAADFAQVTSDCRDVVCDSAADGSFHCEIAPPRGDSICIEHPRQGRRRIELDHRRGTIELGTVQLIIGGTIRVTKPLHVVLPGKTTLSLLRDGRPTSDEKRIGARDVVEFEGLAPGRYDLLLAGPEPLQRKLIRTEVAEGVVDLTLALDAFKLTGDVRHGNDALPGATVSIEEKAWRAELKADQSGRFEAELWSPGSYAVVVRSPRFDHPYGVMRRTSPSDSHWRLEVPRRTISGSVVDAETGRAPAQASVAITSESEETRWSRNLAVREDGKYRVDGVAAGAYRLHANAPGYLPSETVEIFVAKDDGDRALDIRLERGKAVTIVAVDPRGAPIAEALVLEILDADALQPARVTQTRADGTGTVSVPERRPLFVGVLPRAGSFALARLDARTAQNAVTIPVGDPVADLALSTRLEDGTPLPKVRYVLRYEGMHVPLALLRAFASRHAIPLETDSQGFASVRLVPAGRYEIQWRVPSEIQLRSSAWLSVQAVPGKVEVQQTFLRR